MNRLELEVEIGDENAKWLLAHPEILSAFLKFTSGYRSFNRIPEAIHVLEYKGLIGHGYNTPSGATEFKLSKCGLDIMSVVIEGLVEEVAK